MSRTFRVGARGSALSLRQTQEVIDHLSRLHREARFELVVVQTPAEQNPDAPLHTLQGKGHFTRTLEESLRSGWIDLAVHSAKDLPTELGEGLVIAAVPAREDPRDALIAAKDLRFDQLPDGCRVGTGSPRRIAQILRARRFLQPVLMRGNLDTRLHRLEEGRVDALIVAMAGINRMGWETMVTEILEPRVMLPAGGQGALILEARGEDIESVEMAKSIDHELSRWTVVAERAVLLHLSAGCQLPVGVLAAIEGRTLCMSGRLLSRDGGLEVSWQVSGRPKDAESLGKKLAKKLLKKGGKNIVAEWSKIEQVGATPWGNVESSHAGT